MPASSPLQYAACPSWRVRVRTGFFAVVFACASRRGRRTIIAAACVLAALVPCGYWSSRASMAACERHTARWIAKTEFHGQPFHTVRYHEAEQQAIFRAAGFQPMTSAPVGRPGYPCARINHARSVGPFIVEVGYGRTFAPLMGAGGIRRYVCLFGHVVLIGDRPTWVS